MRYKEINIPKKGRNKYNYTSTNYQSSPSSSNSGSDSGAVPSHSHNNLDTLDRLRHDQDEYLYIRLSDTLDKIKAGFADEAGSLSDEYIESLKDLLKDIFLSKTTDDTAQGLIKFIKGITIGGSDKGIDANGNATLLSLILGSKGIDAQGNANLLSLILGDKGIDEDGNATLKSLLLNAGKGIDAQGNATLLSLILGQFGITAQGVATFLNVIANGIQSSNFTTGILGSGFTLKKDENGDSYLEIDRALFRKSATFVELIIQSLKYVGGQIILSPASMHCIKVEETTTGYKCYFRASDGDRAINNEFVVDDLARSQTFNIKEGASQNVSNGYYWRKVIAVGNDWVELSKTDCDTGSTVPQVGDDIVQLGNTSDITRQSAIVLSAYGDGAPYIKQYKGIGSGTNPYSLEGKEKINISASEVMIIADSFKFSTGESLKDYIEGMAKDSWKDGMSVPAGTTLPFCNILFKSKVATSQPPCDILQDENGAYLTDDDGAYLVPTDENGNPYINADWVALLDNNSLENRVMTYSDSLFQQANDKILLKVSKDVYEADLEGVQTRLSSAESTIVQQAEQIAARVTTTDFNSTIEDTTLASQQYAEAQKTLAITTANAYADGIVSDEEERAIADAQAKANAAQQAAIEAAATDATSKADAAVTTAKSYTDGQITLTSNSFTVAIQAEETRAIADAQAKANAAQQAAIAAAATDAQAKANDSYTLSKTYTDSQIAATNTEIALKVSRSEMSNVKEWKDGNKYSFPVMLSFLGMLFQVKSTVESTYNPPCDILQDENGAYLTDNDGAYLVPTDDNGDPYINTTDWVVIMDNYQYTKRLEAAEAEIIVHANEIALKVTQAEVDASQQAVKSDLLATGIDIENKVVKLTADKFLIQDNNGGQMAVFELDANGLPKLSTQYINADLIVTSKCVAKINGVMRAAMNLEGDGAYRIYYPNGQTNLELKPTADDAVIASYQSNGALNWYIGADGEFHKTKIDAWENICLVQCGTTSLNRTIVSSFSDLQGIDYMKFSAVSGSTQSAYDGLTVDGEISISALPANVPTSSYIPDGWYTYPGTPYNVLDEEGYSHPARKYMRYIDGYRSGEVMEYVWNYRFES